MGISAASSLGSSPTTRLFRPEVIDNTVLVGKLLCDLFGDSDLSKIRFCNLLHQLSLLIIKGWITEFEPLPAMCVGKSSLKRISPWVFPMFFPWKSGFFNGFIREFSRGTTGSRLQGFRARPQDGEIASKQLDFEDFEAGAPDMAQVGILKKRMVEQSGQIIISIYISGQIYIYISWI